MRPISILLVSLFFGACGAERPDPAVGGAAPPPPQALGLVGSAAYALPGGAIGFDVWDAAPGGAVVLGASRAQAGGHPCPPALAGACMDLFNPVVRVGTARADAAGHARFLVTLPAGLPPGTVRLQAASAAPVGQGSRSEVAELAVLDPAGDADGDGLGSGDEIAQGTDPTAADSDRGGLVDGVDPLPLDPSDDEGAPPARWLPGDLDLALPAGEQSAAAAASGDGVTLVVWQDSRAGASTAPQFGSAPVDLFAARYDADGVALDAVPILLAQGALAQGQPDVAWNGSEWLVVWASSRFVGPFGLTTDVHAARVSRSGGVVDAEPWVIDGNPGQDASAPAVASDGAGWLVGWRAGVGPGVEAVLAAAVDPVGVVGAPEALWVTAGGVGFYTPYEVDIAWATDRYLVVGSHLAPGGSDAVYGRALDASGRSMGPELRITDGIEASIASNGAGFGLAWYDTVGWGRVLTSPVALDGRLAVPGGVVLDTQLYGTLPTTAIAWGGASWFVGWDPGGPLRMAEVGVNGAVVAGSPFEASPTADAREPFLAARAGGGVIAGWTDRRLNNPMTLGTSDLWAVVIDGAPRAELPLTASAPAQSQVDLAGPVDGAWLVVFVSETTDSQRVMGQRVDADGVALDAEPFEIATSTTRLGAPAVAANGDGWLAVWEDGGVRAQRVDAQGALLGAPQLVLTADQPDVAAFGDDFLVVGSQMPYGQWQTRLAVARRVLGDGTMPDPAPTLLSLGFNQHPAVTADAQGWVVAWQSHFAPLSGPITIAACAVQPDGVALLSFIAGQSAVYNEGAAVASSGDTTLLTWTDGDGVRGRRFDAGLTPLDPLAGLLVTDAPGDQLRANVAWDGAAWRVVWLDTRAEGSAQSAAGLGDVYAATVSTDGSVAIAGGAAVAADPGRLEVLPAVSGAGGASLTTWTAMDPDTATLRTGVRRSP